jgi:dTDP-glucose 4,6-dehydratase
VRLFNTYGPGEYFAPFRSAICRFAYSALMGLPYTVYLNHRRTSIFISDAVRTLAALTDVFVPGEVYNIGGTESHDMKSVSDTILGLLGKDDLLVSYSDAEPFTTKNKAIDCLKAARALGHTSSVPLRVGLAQTIAWMRRIYVDQAVAEPVDYLERAS